jgi:hypothetical protein
MEHEINQDCYMLNCPTLHMIPVTHQLKAAPNKIAKALLRAERKQRTVSFYHSIGAFPKEYLIVHQKPEEARTKKIQAEAQIRREARKKKRLGLAFHQRTTTTSI